MPELPEVETVMRGIAPALEGAVLRGVTINRYDLRGGIPADMIEVLQGATVRTLQRRGKYIIVHLDRPQVAILHLGMSGRVRLYDQAALYQAEKHDHVLLDLSNGQRLVFNDPRRFGMLYWRDSATWTQEPPFNAMGPEPLGNAFSAPALAQALERRPGAIKTVLLDQNTVAGLGNIYVCEALWRAHIHPERAANTLKAAEHEALYAAIRTVLEDAIASGGSSLRDYKKADGGLGYFQHHFKVYAQTGQLCPAPPCRGTIEHCVQAGRSTFFCPQCQV